MATTRTRHCHSRALWLTLAAVCLWCGLIVGCGLFFWGCTTAKRDTPRPGFNEWRHPDGRKTKLDGSPLSLMGKRRAFVEDVARKERA